MKTDIELWREHIEICNDLTAAMPEMNWLERIIATQVIRLLKWCANQL